MPKRNLRCDAQGTTRKEGYHAKKQKVESVYHYFPHERASQVICLGRRRWECSEEFGKV